MGRGSVAASLLPNLVAGSAGRGEDEYRGGVVALSEGLVYVSALTSQDQPQLRAQLMQYGSDLLTSFLAQDGPSLDQEPA